MKQGVGSNDTSTKAAGSVYLRGGEYDSGRKLQRKKGREGKASARRCQVCTVCLIIAAEKMFLCLRDVPGENS